MVKSLRLLPDKHGGLRLISAALILAAAAFTSSAQLAPKSISVSVAPTTGLLTGPDESVKFFQYTLVSADQWLVKRTNGTANNLTISGNAHVISGSQLILDSGGQLIGSAGSIVQLRNASLLDSTTGQGPSYATRKDYVDGADLLLQIAMVATSPKIITAKAALLTESVSNILGKLAYVKNNTDLDGAGPGTVLDGAKGLWIWDYASTDAESAVILKSSNLSPGDPGRWLKLN